MSKKLKNLLDKAKEKFNELLENTKENGESIKSSYQEMEQQFREWRDAEFKKFNDALKQEEVSYCMKYTTEICTHDHTVLVNQEATDISEAV